MNLRQLRNFITIVEMNSITAAAEHLNIAQPALSRQVKALEDQLNVRLLMRHGRGVMPTQEGIRLASKAALILEQVAELADDLSGTERLLDGTLTLGLPPSVADLMAIHLIERTMQTFPGVNLRITSGFSGHVQDWLTRGKIDLGVVYEGQEPRSARVRPIIMEELFLIQRPDDPQAQDGPATRAEVFSQRLILPNPEHSLRVLIDRAAADIGAEVQVALEIDIMRATLSCVERGIGSTIYPMVSVYEHVREGRLIARPIVDDPITRRLVLLSPVNRPTMRLSDVFSEFLISEVHKMNDAGDWPGKSL